MANELLKRLGHGTSSLISYPISLKTCIHLTGRQLFLPFYHTVSDEPLPHIKHLYSIKDTRRFESELDLILQHFEPIDAVQLKSSIDSGKPLKNKSFLLSFDDGLSGVYNIVAPLLKAKGVPAIIFLNNSFIDNKALFYRFKVSLIIDQVKNSKLSAAIVKELHEKLDDINIPTGDIKYRLTSVSYTQKSILNEIADVVGVNFNEYLDKQKPYLTTEQITSLKKDGFTFGGHTKDHLLLSELTLEEQIAQSRESIEMVKEKFDLDHRLFSFPFTDAGITQSYFQKLYSPDDELADLSFGSAGIKTEKFKSHFQRTPMELLNGNIKQEIKKAFIYFWLLRIFGKHIINRN